MTIPLRVHGVDLSRWQKGALDFAVAKAAGVRFVYHKATEGTSVRDPLYYQRRCEVKAAGIRRFGAYAFGSPEGGDALAEVTYFLDFAQPKPGDMRPALDLEVNPGRLTRAQLTDWVRVWVEECERRIGVKPIIYTPYDLDDNFGCPLWVARYSDANAEPRIPQPWDRYSIRQFSNGLYGVPNEVPGLGHVDLNHLPEGQRLSELRIPRATTPPPPVKTTIAFHAGRFDRTPARLARSVDRIRAVSSLSGHTEAGSKEREVAGFVNEGRDYFRATGRGAGECAAEWDEDFWIPRADPYATPLTTMTYFRSEEYGGKEAPPVHALVLPMTAALTGRPVNFILAHMPLDNTPRRSEVWVDCCRGLRRLISSLRSQTPGVKTLILADWNKDFRDMEERADIRRHLARPMGLTQAWSGRMPSSGGTFGNQLIDGALTDLEIADCYLLTDDKASDHRPFALDVIV